MIWRFLIVYLLSAIAANLIMTFLMRYSEHHDDNRYALNIWNYLAGTLISIIFLKDKSVIFSGDFITLFLGIINGIGFVTALVLIQISIRRNGAPLTTTFNRLGILIPTILWRNSFPIKDYQTCSVYFCNYHHEYR